MDPHLPEHYLKDFAGSALRTVKSVHVEALPDGGLEEIAFLEGLLCAEGRCDTLAAYVASCDLSRPDAQAALEALVAASARVRGVRWITNWAGALGERERPVASRATWPRVAHDYSPDPQFEAGLALLPKFGLSFDLQANPSQLRRWSDVLGRHPAVPTVLDHIGSLRSLAGDGNAADQEQLAEWRDGMQALSALPQVCVKLSMLGYSVPGWHEYGEQSKEALARDIVLETISLFGPRRCMFATNWPVDAEGGLQGPHMLSKYREWVKDFSDGDQEALFAGTAERFYRI